MIKKVVVFLLVLAAVCVVGFLVSIYPQLQEGEQITMQYDNEVISKYKQPLDFSAFEESLSKLSTNDIKRLDSYILDKDIDSIQKAILNGDITCEDVVLYYIHRIKQYDSQYNSVIQLNKNALKLARKQDEMIKNKEELGRLFGTVILIKDNISEMTMNTTAGAYALKDLTTKRDSFIVKQLKDEDAIILGKANLSEWANFLSEPSSNGFSVLGGQTKNAYGQYDAGGSSSGSAVAASLNFTSITLGSETAGSVIHPAGQNAVVGLKPTAGLLSRDLIIPITEAQDTAGIIGRSVNDVFELFKVTLAYDENDPLAKNVDIFDKESLTKPLDASFLQGKRLGIVKDDPVRNEKIKQELQALGAEVIDIDMNVDDDMIDMMSVFNYGIVEDVKAYLNHPDVNSPFKSLAEILAFNKEDVDNRIPYGAKLHEDALSNTVSKEEYEQIVLNNRKSSRDIIDNALKDNSITAIVSFSNKLSDIYAPALYPAITVPAGYMDNGEPLGITFVASLNDDATLLNIGYCYEQGTHHRKIPTLDQQ